MPDPEDLLSESLQTLYDYTPVAHSSAGSLFTYNYPGQIPRRFSSPLGESVPDRQDSVAPIELQTPDTQPANWSLHASSIWMSSLFIADHLAELRLDYRIASAIDRGEPLRVLELGAGAGLPGILIARCYDRIRVVSSDYPDEELISTLADNVQRNNASARCRVVPYAWGSDPSVLLESAPHDRSPPAPAFDIVVAADTLWNPDLHRVFAKTLALTLRRSADARIYLVAGLHTGRYTIQAFLRTVPEVGLELEEATEREVNGNKVCSWSVERGGEETEQDRRRWVVWMVLRWSLPVAS